MELNGIQLHNHQVESIEEENEDGTIPYTAIYDTLDDFEEERGYFIPAEIVTAVIVNAHRDTDTRFSPINRYIYTIELHHEDHQWVIQRRYGDFRRLKTKLKRAPSKDKHWQPIGRNTPGQKYSEDTLCRAPSGQKYSEKSLRLGDRQKLKLVNGIVVTKGTLEWGNGKKTLEENGKVGSSETGNDLAPFPSIPDSLISEEKLEERKLKLQNYLTSVLEIDWYRNQPATAKFLGVTRLSFVYDLGLKYSEGLIKERPGGSASNRCDCCITRCCEWKKRWLVAKDNFLALLDKSGDKIIDVMLYDCRFEISDVFVDGEVPKNALAVINLQRELFIRCEHQNETDVWMRQLWRIVREKGDVWLQVKDYGSSYPERMDSTAEWFVDGKGYMERAADVMERATQEIFITGWWLNPHIYMKRPMKDNHWRLDEILKRKAENGIRVFVLIYQEVTLAMGLNSAFTESYLKALHPNIKVMRHPDHYYDGVFTWAHHEKTVIVDQSIAFVGGIDLCYGRWDDHEHRLTDLGAITESSIPSIPYTDDCLTEELSTTITGSSPHQAHCTLENGTVPESAKNQTDLRPRFDFAAAIRRGYGRVEEPGWEQRIRPQGFGPSEKEFWPGKDYVNFIHKDIPEPEKPFEDFIDRTRIPRLPWHDIASAVYGSAARDVARHFIQRWNKTKLELLYNDDSYPLLIPKSYDNLISEEMLQKRTIPCSVQVLRSGGLWSTGMNATESSIHQAYLELIRDAKHFVYIENQFFISQLGGLDVLNQVSNAIFERILQAHNNKETFRVFIVMPLLPAFEKESGSMPVILHWTYTSISKGPRSLLKRLEEAIGDPSPYVTFCSLRTHSMMTKQLVTELIYVHSKLLIVDDKYCLIGSANINDRSQLGDRDSEVAILVKDTHFTGSMINGQPYESGVFAGSIRRHLFREHLGLSGSDSDIDINDLLSDKFFQFWNDLADENTSVYEKVFECAPSDKIRTLEQLMAARPEDTLAQTNPEEATKLLNDVRGYLVRFPAHFLTDSELAPSIMTAEGWLPTYTFV